MKVLQAAAWYPPFSLGGTEVYLSQLVSELADMGIENTVAVPAAGEEQADYEHQNVPVVRYPVNETPGKQELAGLRPHDRFEDFVSILRQHREAIYHQHSWTRGCGLFHLQAAHSLGVRTVVTVHVPANICLSGTMMKYGKRACAGSVTIRECASCWAQGQGVPQLLADAISALPLDVAKSLRKLPGSAGSLLAARALASDKLQSYKQMMKIADRVVVVSQWLYEALLARGMDKDKLILSRHGIDSDTANFIKQSISGEFNREADGAGKQTGTLRLLYLGRWDPVKGLDVVIRAIHKLPKTVSVQLVIHAVGTGQAEKDYENRIRTLVGDDPRIKILPPVERNQIQNLMAQFDVLVVPSQWMETGPLVVLEGLSNGLFVIGSDLGGIAEWVHQETGLLVSASDVDAWTAAIQNCVQRKLRDGVIRNAPKCLRTMNEVSSEMRALYEKLC